MISADKFVEQLRHNGFNHYTGVPCSFLTPLINYVIDHTSLNYISATNEGDALAIAAGMAIAGKPSVVMMQNSGLGNAVNPLTSLTKIFRIPVLIIVTHRGQPGLQDEPQHQLMGQITGKLLGLMNIPHAVFPKQEDEIQPTLAHALNYIKDTRLPYALIMHKDSVSKSRLKRDPIPDIKNRSRLFLAKTQDQSKSLPDRQQALERIITLTPESNSVVIATTGYTGRALFSISDRPNQLYIVGSMGCASSLALGISLIRQDLRIVVIDGDGALLMRMGNLASIGSYAQGNLYHILLDNQCHDSTGGQDTVSKNIQFAEIAKANGYAMSLYGDNLECIDELFSAPAQDGAVFLHLKINRQTPENLPRPNTTPDMMLDRFMAHIGSHF